MLPSARCRRRSPARVQQKLKLILALSGNGHWLLLDEPFNGLDSAMAERIFMRILPWLTARKSIVLLHEVPSFVEQKNIDYRSLNVDLT